MSLHIAKVERTMVAFIKRRPFKPVNMAVFDIECEGIRVLPSSHVGNFVWSTAWLLAAWAERMLVPMRLIRRYREKMRLCAGRAASNVRVGLQGLKIRMNRRQQRAMDSIISGAGSVAKDRRYPKPLRAVLERQRSIWKGYRKRLRIAQNRERDVWEWREMSPEAAGGGGARARPDQGQPNRRLHVLSDAYMGSNFRRRIAEEPLRARLRPRQERYALELARRVGLGPDSKLVTLHARESGFHGLREDQDKGSGRNARIETYCNAVDHLVARGYTIVRIGDPAMTPVAHRGVIDLATSSQRAPLLELWCLMKSDFMICCDSGPNVLCFLADVPMLTVNCVGILHCYPMRRQDLYLPKRIFHRDTGLAPSLEDLLGEVGMGGLYDLRDVSGYGYLDNSPEEIELAVSEMLDCLEKGPVETAAQREFRHLVLRAANRLKENESSKIRRKWNRRMGSEPVFLGDGRVAHFFAERYLRDSCQLPMPGRA